MLFRILFFLFLVTCISYGITWLFDHNGMVDFYWLGYQAHTTTAFLIVCVVFGMIVFALLVQVLLFIMFLPERMKKKYQKTKFEQNLITLQKGYAALLSGDIVEARRLSSKLEKISAPNDSLQNLTYMLAAKTAENEGDFIAAQDNYNKLAGKKRYKFFAVKGLLNSAFRQGNIEKAILHAEEAYKLKPDVEGGAHSLLELYKKAGHLNRAEDFLNRYKRKFIIRKDRHNKINIKNELGDISYIRAQETLQNARGDKIELTRAMRQLDKSLDADPYNTEKIILMMKLCKGLNNERKAKDVMERAWEKVQSYKIGAAYLNVFFNNDYKKAARKKLRAIEDLRAITDNHEIIEKLKDKVYDVQIEY